MVNDSHLAPETAAFYLSALGVLDRAGIPFLVGGAFALGHYTGIKRFTKDFDIFVLPSDAPRILETFRASGYEAELTFPHWLGKVYGESGDFIDVIYSSGNGVAVVDEGWFRHSVEGTVLGTTMRLCPAEEIIWSKAFVIERERYDGADIAHLLRARGQSLDWPRLLRRFGRNWRVLLSHLVLFGYVYPGERDTIPHPVMQELMGLLHAELAPPQTDEKVCHGTLLSRQQYLIDVRAWGYADARLHREDVHMDERDIAHWTAAIEGDPLHHVDHQDVADHRGGG